MSPAIWTRVSLELAKTEREAIKAVSETFEALRERLQVAALETEETEEPTDD